MNPSPFDLERSPLERGLTFIEASAGTGKTFNIAGIVLRLILEEKLPLSEILVVTFTKAATQELRDRVRTRLQNALEDLRKGQSRDPLLQAFLSDPARQAAMVALNVAVQNFDEARIFTTHGFCQRSLRNHAFESGAPFDLEFLADSTRLFEELVHDFWRARFYTAKPLLARLVLAHGRSPETWTKLLKSTRNHPDLLILPAPEPGSSLELFAQIETLFHKLGEAWSQHGEALSQSLSAHKSLSQDKSKSPFAPDALAENVANLNQLFSDFSNTDPACLNSLADFSSSSVSKHTHKRSTAPKHLFFDLCEAFRKLVERLLRQLDHEFLAFVESELPRRKERLNVLTYDDLLLRLRQALRGQNGAHFATSIGSKFRAALIDEFQDTDPLQHEIFRTIFADGSHYLFFIGDPKQAIYAFRGADVFTYLKAISSASRAYTLGTNWRSEKSLLTAINTLFANTANPFRSRDILYRPVHAPEIPRPEFQVLQESEPSPPLRLRFLGKGGNDDLSNEAADKWIFEAVVADIKRVMSSGASLGNRPVRWGDLAVLVRSNTQATRLQETLRRHGIHSVLQTVASVFKSQQASEMSRLLAAILEPGRESALKTGLSTPLLNLNASDILAFEHDEGRWQTWIDTFLKYRKTWQTHGFMSAFRHILLEQDVRQRLVQTLGGERRLTNFLHLAELLHEAETDLRLTPEALCIWLRDQRKDPNTAAETHQLRLESDGDAVLLSTIHKSKGLEYPVVFCPFLWRSGDSMRSEILFHDPQNQERLTFDLRKLEDLADGDPEKAEVAAHDTCAENENHAEAMRLLYVAVTRAQNRCYLYVPDVKDLANSPLGALLGKDQETRQALAALVERATGTMELTEIDPEDDRKTPLPAPENLPEESLQARVFSGNIPPWQMITSFTGLMSGKAEEEPDRDAAVEALPPVPTEGALASLAEFERGTRAGNFLHDVLENLDFQAPDSLPSLVAEKLLAYGIADNDWTGKLSTQLRRVLKTQLAPGLAPELSLDKVSLSQRLAEVEFSHPLRAIRPAQLQNLFAAHGNPQIPAEFPTSLGRLQFRPVEGYLRGFIDLLFCFEGRYYVLDWKSNWLGERIANYDQAAMRECMLHHSYFLQYHLYTVATDLFLRRRIPNYDYQEHFGGVLYVFLRGVDPLRPDCGTFCDRPSPALVHALRQTLIGDLP